MFIARTATTLVFFVIFLFGLYSPFEWSRHIVFVVVALASLLGTHEYYHMARRLKVRPSPWPGHLISLAFLFDAYWLHFGHFVHLFIACFWLLLFTQVFFKAYDRAIVNMACSLFGSIYVGLPMAVALFIFRFPERFGFAPPEASPHTGGHLLLFLVLTAWMMDTGGYLVGKPFGRHKMTPKLSPNKSWEGMAGGILMSILTGVLLRRFCPGMDRVFSWSEAIFLPAVFAIVGTVGDLAESAFKRDAGIKDSGKTYTGHGGMLDIIDSILLCAPVFYLYLSLFRAG